jgi:hypothetical protein
MTYPPNNPGYQVPQQPAGYGAPPGLPQAAAGPNRLPAYLAGTVLGLGLLAYLASFGPQLSISTEMGPFGGAEFTATGLSYWTVAALIAALLAGVGLAPKVHSYIPVVAALSILAVLLVAAQIFNSPAQFSIGWGLWLGLTLTVLQAAAAVAALLFEAGVLSAPAPRPRAQQYPQYGPPPGYYPPPQGSAPPGYPTPYAGYPTGPVSVGPPADDTHTPPTGFPSYRPASEADSASRPSQSQGGAPRQDSRQQDSQQRDSGPDEGAASPAGSGPTQP